MNPPWSAYDPTAIAVSRHMTAPMRIGRLRVCFLTHPDLPQGSCDLQSDTLVHDVALSCVSPVTQFGIARADAQPVRGLYLAGCTGERIAITCSSGSVGRHGVNVVSTVTRGHVKGKRYVIRWSLFRNISDVMPSLRRHRDHEWQVVRRASTEKSQLGHHSASGSEGSILELSRRTRSPLAR